MTAERDAAPEAGAAGGAGAGAGAVGRSAASRAGAGPGSGPGSGPGVSRVVVRPGRWRLGCRVLAGVLVVVFAVAAAGSVWASTAAAGQRLGGADRVSLAVLGLVLAAVVVAAGERPLVVADAAGLRVRNFFAQYDLDWSAVAGFTLVGRLPWAWIELSVGENRSVFAVQTLDGPTAAAALRDLRALLAASRRPGYAQGGTDHA